MALYLSSNSSATRLRALALLGLEDREVHSTTAQQAQATFDLLGDETLGRILDALKLPPAAIERAQEFAQYPMGRDGTLPPDVRHDPAASRKTALKLAQEVGKAFAHVTLALLDLRAGTLSAPADKER